ncbi:integrase core domain-containing protein [Promicromonospora sp. NPDC057138]|uniref:integrase core domain-containing protein n=1 Tax=Promicromonospora sp. NPDC057138 TaxID=3346031 RepID=UPI0036363370
MAEALNSLFKAELVRGPARRRIGPWRGIDDLELAIAEWVDWYNERRLHGELGHVPPAEHEAAYWTSRPEQPADHEAAHHDRNHSTHDTSTASHTQTNPVLATAETN